MKGIKKQARAASAIAEHGVVRARFATSVLAAFDEPVPGQLCAITLLDLPAGSRVCAQDKAAQLVAGGGVDLTRWPLRDLIIELPANCDEMPIARLMMVRRLSSGRLRRSYLAAQLVLDRLPPSSRNDIVLRSAATAQGRKAATVRYLVLNSESGRATRRDPQYRQQALTVNWASAAPERVGPDRLRDDSWAMAFSPSRLDSASSLAERTGLKVKVDN